MFLLEAPPLLLTAWLVYLFFDLTPPYPGAETLVVPTALTLLACHRLTALTPSRRWVAAARTLLPLAPSAGLIASTLLQEPDLVGPVLSLVLDGLLACLALAVPCLVAALGVLMLDPCVRPVLEPTPPAGRRCRIGRAGALRRLPHGKPKRPRPYP